MTLHDTIKDWIQDTLSVEGDFVLEHPGDMHHGDFAANVALVMAKREKKNPRELAEMYAEKLRARRISEIFDIEVAGPGFINLTVVSTVFAEAIKKIVTVGPTFGEHSHVSGGRILVEYAQQNPFKEFHAGHMMNIVIGESVARIVEAEGVEVVRVSYHGDVGLHVAKTVWGLQNLGVGTDVDIVTLSQAYALGAKLFESDNEVKQEIVATNKKIYEKSNEEINILYEKGLAVSLAYFGIMYARLGSTFDKHLYESQSGPIGKQLVEKYLDKGVFEKSNGAVIFPGEKYGLHTRVFLSSEGLPVYEAKEVGLMEIKKDLFGPFDKSITITANEQDAFFTVVEKALEQVFPDLNGKLLHLSHGILKLPTGKMSSRTGDVIKIESLIDKVKESAGEKIRERLLSDGEKDAIAEMVALAALKFTILRQAIGGDIIFDVDKALSLDGDSGPYLQYSAVRAQTILRKAEGVVILSTDMPDTWKTTHIERLLERYPSVIRRAALEYAPHTIVTYLVELAGAFNSFYASHKIIDATNVTSSYRLAITTAFVDVMTAGLGLLGMCVPPEM